MTAPMLSIEQVCTFHCEFRDHIAEVIYGIHEKSLDVAFSTVLFKNFSFCFNTYKSIALLLPDLYYEQGCALLRIMWEASLNLEWVCIQPVERSRTYLQFTVVETYRVYQLHIQECEAKGDSNGVEAGKILLKEFENAYKGILDGYRNPRGKNRKRLAQRFSLGNLEHVATELGGHWLIEYRSIYPLLCFYAHGSPGAVAFPKPFVNDVSELNSETFAEQDRPRTIQLALWSMAVLERPYFTLLRELDINDMTYLDDLDRRTSFRLSLTGNVA